MTLLGRAAIGPRVVFLSALFTALAPLATDFYLPVFPEIARSFSASDSVMTLAMTAVLVGLAIGQLVAGPLSDQRGRRPVLIVGLIVFIITTVASALAPTIEWFLIARFLSGLGTAAAFVVARAMVADALTPLERPRGFALLGSITGITPAVAPILGGLLALIMGWREIFLVLAGISVVMLLFAVIKTPETMPAEHRQQSGIGHALRDLGTLFVHRRFMTYVLILATTGGMLFAYISSSSFVLEGTFGLSPSMFSIVFAVNSIGIFIMSLVSRALVLRLGPNELLWIGQSQALVGSLITVVGLLISSLPVLLIGLFVAISSLSMQFANASALGINASPVRAGSASALLGIAGFLVGGLMAPVSGLGGAAMGIMMAVFCAIGLAVHRWMVPPGPAPEPIPFS